MNCRAALLLVLLLPFAARAEERSRTHLAFDVYAAGLPVLEIGSDVDLGPRIYRIDLSYRATGLIGVLFPTNIASFVQGYWAGDQPAPVRFASWGHSRGMDRRTVIDYEAGQPVIKTHEPPLEEDRDPVPEALQHDTIDTLSAMAMLVREVAKTGRCDGHATTFDGERLSEIASHTVGMETLPPEFGTSFSGPALRCDVEGKQTGGFLHDEPMEELRKIHYSTAWLASVMPGGPALPVRVRFETRYFGHGTAYLSASGPSAPLADSGSK